MNIGINTRLLLSGRIEGIAVFTWEICRRMAENNPQDTFYFFFDRQPDSSYSQLKNVIPIVIRPQARHPILWKYWFDYALPKAFEKYNIDAFFSPETYISLNTKVPSVIVTHDLGFLHFPKAYKSSHQAYFKKNIRKFHQNANHIIAVSEYTKQDIIKQLRVPEAKITIVYNAVRKEFQRISEKEKNEIQLLISGASPYILYVGSIHPRKNIEGLISGFEDFKSRCGSEHKLILFGRWAYGNKGLKDRIAQSPIKDEVIYKSDQDCEVAKVMAAADSFVYPSFHEGFGIPIIEAMACGIPVVTSDIGAMKEVGGEAAILIDPKDAQSISNGIETSIFNEELLSELEKKAAENLERFSWNTSAERVYSTINDVIKSKDL